MKKLYLILFLLIGFVAPECCAMKRVSNIFKDYVKSNLYKNNVRKNSTRGTSGERVWAGLMTSPYVIGTSVICWDVGFHMGYYSSVERARMSPNSNDYEVSRPHGLIVMTLIGECVTHSLMYPYYRIFSRVGTFSAAQTLLFGACYMLGKEVRKEEKEKKVRKE